MRWSPFSRTSDPLGLLDSYHRSDEIGEAAGGQWGAAACSRLVLRRLPDPPR